MSTTTEEVLMRLGFATDQFDAQTRKLKGQMAETAEHIVEHMKKPRAATLAFHHALHEVTNISPLLGTALQAAVSPVLGMIIALGLGLKKLYDGIKEIRAEMKELAKTYEEQNKIFASPTDKEKDVSKARAESEKKAAEDRRRASKEGNELDNPLERMLEALRRQEEQYDLTRNSAAKLAAQKKALADVDAQVAAAKKPVEDYNSKEAQEARQAIEFQKEKAASRIKTLEAQAEKEKEIQNKNKAAFEEQRKIDTGDSSIPNIKLLMDTGDTVRHEKVNLYKNAVEAEEAYKRAIKQTEEGVAKLEEKLKEGQSTHAEEFSQLKKLESAHKELSAAVARTEKEIDRAKDAEAKETTRLMDEAEKSAKEKGKLQADFDRRRAALAKEEKRAEIEPYLPTIAQLAKLPSWAGDDSWQNRMPQMPHEVSAAADKAGSMARELQAREGDLRDTVMNEGPNSSRAKEDLDRIRTLKDSLEKSGFIKEDHTQKVSEKMTELLELAKEKGLIVKPMNGK